MKTRFTFGGDEHVYVEIDEEMSLDAFFKALSMSNAVRDAKIAGVTEICPANASFQVRFDPDVIDPEDIMQRLKELEHKADTAEKRLKTRIIEIPVFYRDPWTQETLMRFRERQQGIRIPAAPIWTMRRASMALPRQTNSSRRITRSHGSCRWSASWPGCRSFISLSSVTSSFRCRNTCGHAPIRPS